ncbi:MAG: hypothetical protein QM775_10955 [Pirellulales bacterium]
MSQGSSVLQEIDQSFDQWYTELKRMLNKRSERMGVKAKKAKALKDKDLSKQYVELKAALEKYEKQAESVKKQMTDVAGAVKNANPKVPEHADEIKKIVEDFTKIGNAVRTLRDNEQKETDKTTGIVADTSVEVAEKFQELEILSSRLNRLKVDVLNPDDYKRRKVKDEANLIRGKQKVEALEVWEAELLEKAQKRQEDSAKFESGNQFSDETMAHGLDQLADKLQAPELKDVEKIMKEHRSAVPAEEAAFFETKSMEDVLEHIRAIPGEADKRKAMLEKMKSAKDAALDRYSRMGTALKAVSSDVGERNTRLGPNAAPMVNQASRFHGNMLEHIPLDYRTQFAKFDARIENIICCARSGRMRKDEVGGPR